MQVSPLFLNLSTSGSCTQSRAALAAPPLRDAHDMYEVLDLISPVQTVGQQSELDAYLKTGYSNKEILQFWKKELDKLSEARSVGSNLHGHSRSFWSRRKAAFHDQFPPKRAESAPEPANNGTDGNGG